MVYPRGKPATALSAFPRAITKIMRTIGACVCLLLLSLIGRLFLTGPTPKTRFLAIPAPRALLEATAVFQKGNYDRAAEIFSRGYEAAGRSGNPELAARFLWGRGNCYFATRQYRQAMECYLSARAAFERSGNRPFVEAMNGSLASVYSQLGANNAAIDSARRALDALEGTDSKGHRPRLLVLL